MKDAAISITGQDVQADMVKIDSVQEASIGAESLVSVKTAAVQVDAQWRAQCRLKQISSKLIKKLLRARKPIRGKIRKANSLKRSSYSRKRKQRKKSALFLRVLR